MLSAPALAPARSLAPGRALDVGCGRGALGAVLIAHGWRVDGVEPSPDAVEAARERGVDARPGTLSSLALDDSVYDLVTFMHSLEHTVEPVRDLRRAAQSLQPGGMLAVTVPNFGGDAGPPVPRPLVPPRRAAPPPPLHRRRAARGDAGRRAAGGARRDLHQRGGLRRAASSTRWPGAGCCARGSACT